MMQATPAFRFFVFGIFYAAASLAFALLTRDGVFDNLLNSLEVGTRGALQIFTLFGIVLAFALLRAKRRKQEAVAMVALQITLAYLGVAALNFGFTLFKIGMPALLPYFADPLLADLDAWLHGGSDAWRLVDDTLGSDVARQILPLYQGPWLVLAFLFPVLLVATDDDSARVSRFLGLYCAAWLLIGNLLALSGLSVGPIYYDRLLGTARFSELQQVLNTQGVDQTLLGHVQEFLWRAYSSGEQALGTGISAFPSVHVSVAFTIALYCLERSALLVLPGLAFAAAILLMSVWSGYHYAIDGYVSILAMLGLWGWQHLRARRPIEIPSQTVADAAVRETPGS
ncbi:phosphatase PAP2 family protein [Alloyangia pacifica]|uniref:phosphatase PAP2 family protein n=1 Tax=Alloyangia pacifica TaxID=311180 RepID=UPI001CD7B76A|nr:phosphatase PAP2 family protein [Alloyangia pacifica]MCA0994465.1 phosphatase PAP2 family protein [Alloyangia pacifica]